MEDVLKGGYIDVNNAYEQLQDGCTKTLRIVKELLAVRSFIGEMGDA